MKRLLRWGLAVLAVLAIGGAIAIAVPRLPDRGNGVPTARVTRGPLKMTVHAAGELRAGRSMTLVAPSVGGMLRAVTILTTGTAVKTGEAVVEFDPADQQFALNQAKTEVQEAEQEIVKMKADAVAQAARDEVSLLTARFDVRRAELDVSGNELIGAIDAQKNLLTLEESKRRLTQMEEDIKSRAATNQASLAVVQEKRNKAMLAMQRAQQIIESLVLKSPMDGVVMIKENTDAMGGMMIWGMPMPEYKSGDSVWPGRAIADVIETGQMELRAKVNESDRANLSQGQLAIVDIDTIPGETFKARVGTLSAQARRADFLEAAASSTRQFDVSFAFDQLDARMRGGSSARVTIEGNDIPNALTVPRQAIFQKGGKTHAFVKVDSRFEQREVKVVHRTESRAAVEGLDEGTEIALLDPTVAASATRSTSAPAVPATAGPR
jgi:multidrug efflux pump subunit AcrA (membrane-fusion protein)